jgi:large subunit ribosomal protein L30
MCISQMTDKVIVKNTPQMNKLLYQIKHLIKIKPLTFPNGEPSAEDIQAGATVLNEYGEMFVHKKLGSSDALVAPPQPLSVHDPPPRSADELGLPSDETMRKHLRQQWNIGMDKRGIL